MLPGDLCGVAVSEIGLSASSLSFHISKRISCDCSDSVLLVQSHDCTRRAYRRDLLVRK